VRPQSTVQFKSQESEIGFKPLEDEPAQQSHDQFPSSSGVNVFVHVRLMKNTWKDFYSAIYLSNIRVSMHHPHYLPMLKHNWNSKCFKGIMDDSRIQIPSHQILYTATSDGYWATSVHWPISTYIVARPRHQHPNWTLQALGFSTTNLYVEQGAATGEVEIPGYRWISITLDMQKRRNDSGGKDSPRRSWVSIWALPLSRVYCES